MKQFLRIAIVVLLLMGFGLGVYTMFFKPANKDEVYLTLSKVAPMNDQYDYATHLNDISNFRNAKHSEVINKYVDMISSGNYKIGDATLYSYSDINMAMFNVFNYFYAYSQVVTRTVPKSKLTEVKNAVNAYESSFSNLINNGFKEVKKLQDHILATNETFLVELEGRYQQLILAYRNHLLKFANLVNVTKNFVRDYVFSGDMIEDTDTIADELMMRAFAKALSIEYDFSNTTTADDYMISATVFAKYSKVQTKEKGLAVSYNKVMNVDPSQIDALIGLNTANKRNFDSVKTSFIEVLYGDLENILTTCGFVQGGNA